MDQNRIEVAERQLDRVLQFASRIENKVSVLLASNLGIVAVMLMNLDYKDISTWYIVLPLVAALIMIAESIFHLYKATYPELTGGTDSLIYFFEIAKRTELNYQKDFSGLSNVDLHSDLLGQIWRNSQIMSQKFQSARIAFLWTICSIAPWVTFLVASSVAHNRIISVN